MSRHFFSHPPQAILSIFPFSSETCLDETKCRLSTPSEKSFCYQFQFKLKPNQNSSSRFMQGPMGFRGDTGGAGPVGRPGMPVSFPSEKAIAIVYRCTLEFSWIKRRLSAHHIVQIYSIRNWNKNHFLHTHTGLVVLKWHGRATSACSLSRIRAKRTTENGRRETPSKMCSPHFNKDILMFWI